MCLTVQGMLACWKSDDQGPPLFRTTRTVRHSLMLITDAAARTSVCAWNGKTVNIDEPAPTAQRTEPAQAQPIVSYKKRAVERCLCEKKGKAFNLPRFLCRGVVSVPRPGSNIPTYFDQKTGNTRVVHMDTRISTEMENASGGGSPLMSV